MKRALLFILFLLQYITIYAQDQDFDKKIKIGVYSNIGMNQPIRLTRKYITEDVGPFHGMEAVSMGFSFSGMRTQKLRLEIATGYSIYKCGFELSPPIYAESKIYSETFKTFSLSASGYKYFRSSYYINFGAGVDVEVARKSYWIDSQNGFGFNLSVGKEFIVSNYEIDVSPNIEMHGVLPFHSVKGQQRMLVLGLKAGLRFCTNRTIAENDIITKN